MGCGMVRRVDELGRVVIPKEMRRILNIKSGSSIEMSINENNQVVLEKFSELSNALFLVENLADIIYDEFNLPCILTDDEKVIVAKGVNKKDYQNKKLIENLKVKNNGYSLLSNKPFLENQTKIYDYTYIFSITNEGFNNGYLVILKGEKALEESHLQKVSLLIKFLSSLLKF